MEDFTAYVQEAKMPLTRFELHSLQINVGYRCNLHCNHCHVDAGPQREEMMGPDVLSDCMAFVRRTRISHIDITGGAPELNPQLPYLILGLRKLPSVKTITVRSNLTLLEHKKHSYLSSFFREQQVGIIASLPCYTAENVEAQRGAGVYDSSIRVLQKLNEIGYGKEPNLTLDLVYNPGGPVLPGPQTELEADYKRILRENFAIEFNHLFTITNVPIGRFRQQLEQEDELATYIKMQADHFNEKNLEKVMCCSQVSVDWQGRLYDCDFNQALHLPIAGVATVAAATAQDVLGKAICVGEHCFSCVAGAGSSCQGSLEGTAGGQ